MSISVAPPTRRRNLVLWFGCAPGVDATEAFEQRNFVVDSCADPEQLRTYLTTIAALVLVQSALEPSQAAGYLREYGALLLDYGCIIIVRPASNEARLLTNVIDEQRLPAALPIQEAERLTWQVEPGDPPVPHVHFYGGAVPWSEIANFIVESRCGGGPNLAMEVSVARRASAADQELDLGADSDVLIRRAFADCARVQLIPEPEGKSGAAVYKAYAELAGVRGRWPLPHFVKITDRSKIIAEYRNYEDNVDTFLPFHLRPHLDRERCHLGARSGVIVGDYIEESENLRDVAPRGCGGAAIACLFDRALLGWHRQARPESIPLCVGLSDYFPRRVSAARIARAKELGASLDLNEMRVLFDRCDSVPVLVGPVHGDLHASNVRVRTSDAILIDFYAHRSLTDNFPILYDAASLEASLLVEGFSCDERGIEDWLASLEPLYEQVLTNGVMPEANQANQSFWFYSSVRQIRLYAREAECCRNQYAGALAVALLTKARKDSAASDPERSRRAAAYVLAERVLRRSFGATSAGDEPPSAAP